MRGERASRLAFVGVSAVVLVAGTALTIAWSASMSTMAGMPMPGGWTLSMAWMRMPGQTWAGAAAAFVGMWTAMMAAMMLPSAVPMLWRYHQDVGGAGRLTALAGAGYLLVWAALGAAAFPLGAAVAAVLVRAPVLARAAPVAAGVAVTIAGAWQLTAWKARRLAGCRRAPGGGRTRAEDAGTAWRHGVGLGLHCARCCANLMAIALVVGVMDLRAMAAVGAAVTAERLAPAGTWVARASGAAAVGAGLLLSARAVGLV